MIVDPQTNISGVGLARHGDRQGPFRVDANHQIVRPPGQAFCTERERILETLSNLGQKRGEIFAGLNPRASEAETNHIRERVERIDANIRRVMASEVAIFGADPAFREVCVATARAAENSARFRDLACSYYENGVHRGQAQGRVVHDERVRRADNATLKLATSINRFHEGGLPSGGSTTGGTQLGIHEALQASRELGTREGVVNGLQAELLASRIYRAVGGWRSYVPTRFVKDAVATRAALEGLSRAEAGLVEQSYRDLTGRDLRSDLLHAFGPKHVADMFRSLHADDLAVKTFTLRRELSHPLTVVGLHGGAVRRVYEDLSKREIEEVERGLIDRATTSIEAVHKRIASSVSYEIGKEIAAYREGDPTRAEVLRLKRSLRSFFGASRVVDILASVPSENLGSFEERFKEVTGKELREQLKRHLKPSPRLDLCEAILDRDEIKTQAAKVACSLIYRREFIASHFLGADQDSRVRLQQDYESVYGDKGAGRRHADLSGDFLADLRNSVWKEDYLFLSAFPRLCAALDRVWWPTTGSLPFIESVIRNGRLAPAELLRYFMVGLGTDVEGIYAVLSNRDRAGIKAIEDDYAARYNAGPVTQFLGRLPIIKNFVLTGNLRHDLKVELSGDSEFDVGLMLRGFRDNATPKQLCEDVSDSLVLRKRHETSGLLAKWARLAALRGDSVVRARYERDYELAESYFNEHIASTPHPSPHVVLRFLTLARLADIHANSFRETKNLLGEVFLNSGAFVGVVLGTSAVLALATFSYPIVATASFLGSLGWRLTVGRFVMGHGFGRGEVMFQSARAFIDGVSIFTVRVGVATLGQFIGGQLSKSAAKGGFKTSFNKMIRSMENRVRRQDKARHVLERSSVIESNEDLRAAVATFERSIADRRWPVGEGALELFAPIERVMGEEDENG